MNHQKRYTLQELAHLTGSIPEGDLNYYITDVADLGSAGERDVSFLSNPRYRSNYTKSGAGIIFIDPNTPRALDRNHLISDSPSLAFQTIIDLFHPTRSLPSGFNGIHPTAVIHSSAEIGKNVTICPYAVIDANVKIGDETFIGSSVYVGPDTQIGSHCLIHPHVVIRENCLIENQVIIQPGAIIGSCGYGYTTDQLGHHKKLNQVGSVHVGNQVEIGANTTIDRARFKETTINEGTKIDNLVQIAHGVKVGKHNLFAAQTGIAGSTETGDFVILGGQVAVNGHIKLKDQVMVAGKSGVSKSLEAGKYSGIPAAPIEQYNRNQVLLKNMSKFVDKLEKLEEELKKWISNQ